MSTKVLQCRLHSDKRNRRRIKLGGLLCGNGTCQPTRMQVYARRFLTSGFAFANVTPAHLEEIASGGRTMGSAPSMAHFDEGQESKANQKGIPFLQDPAWNQSGVASLLPVVA
jgi:hypothetical protein